MPFAPLAFIGYNVSFNTVSGSVSPFESNLACKVTRPRRGTCPSENASLVQRTAEHITVSFSEELATYSTHFVLRLPDASSTYRPVTTWRTGRHRNHPSFLPKSWLKRFRRN